MRKRHGRASRPALPCAVRGPGPCAATPAWTSPRRAPGSPGAPGWKAVLSSDLPLKVSYSVTRKATPSQGVRGPHAAHEGGQAEQLPQGTGTALCTVHTLQALSPS